MTIVAVAWIYVVLLMAVAEAVSSQGSVLGAVFTFLLYGVLPLSIVLYLMGAPFRKRARRAAEASEATPSAAAPPDGSHQPAGDTVAAERKEA